LFRRQGGPSSGLSLTANAGGCCFRPFSADNCFVFSEGSQLAVLTAPSRQGTPQQELARILKLQVPMIVKLAERKLSLSEVMRLGNGAIIEFIKRSDEPLELLVNNKAVAVGETVKVGENFGLRITQIGDLKSTIQSLAGIKK
jgi:flagellar motor switch protein FliN/FliY